MRARLTSQPLSQHSLFTKKKERVSHDNNDENVYEMLLVSHTIQILKMCQAHNFGQERDYLRWKMAWQTIVGGWFWPGRRLCVATFARESIVVTNFCPGVD